MFRIHCALSVLVTVETCEVRVVDRCFVAGRTTSPLVPMLARIDPEELLIMVECGGSPPCRAVTRLTVLAKVCVDMIWTRRDLVLGPMT